ncbi:hypothetical protein J4407_03125 [Candidatus Pacearchaeota archaeon]|nr:hypothetical protein [Candidatus Pacearchaeota archaeon]
MVNDIFDNKILCKKCNSEMERANVIRNGFIMRTMICPKKSCNEKIIHPVDEQNYNKFINLRNKEFSVKMRLVGNSYAVSIPKEIVSFMNAQRRIMDDMVKLCFEEMGRLSINFGENLNEIAKVKEKKNGS